MTDRRPRQTIGTDEGRDDRAVSEVVAFVLVFAIILGSVGLLYSTAFGAMMDYQANEQETNAVRAMDSLTDNFNDVLRNDGVNERFGELSLREGRVSSASGGTAVTVTITDDDGERTLGSDDRFADYSDDATVELGEFAYESDDGKIAYEGGGLVRSDETGDVVLREPQLRCNPERNTAVISLVAISAEDRSIQSSTGQGVTMSVENRSSTVYTDVTEVSVDVDDDDTEYDTAWDDILDDWDGHCDSDDFSNGRVVVTLVEVDIEFH